MPNIPGIHVPSTTALDNDINALTPKLLPVGSVVSSMLTEVQFQAINGTEWILMDGRDVTGSEFHSLVSNTSVPDARGLALRGKNNTRSDGNENPDGDVVLGTYQVDEFKSHTHTQNAFAAGNADAVIGPGIYQVTGDTGPAGGNETRMKNITINHFIRIN